MLNLSAESVVHLHKVIQMIRIMGIKAGVALNPATPLSVIKYLLDDLDLVLLMSVNPGFGGQKFIPAVIPKIRELKSMVKDRKLEIQVDGGINAQTARPIREAGATVLVAGTAIFGSDDLVTAVKMLKTAGEKSP